jgi:hypothetical protein
MSEPTSKHHDSTWGKEAGFLILLALIGFFMIPLLFSNFSANKAQFLESRNKVGAMNRGQEGHFFTYKSFANSLNDLQLGIYPETSNYRYSIHSLDNAAFQYGISLHPKIFKRKAGNILGIFPRQGREYAFPSYLGVVWAKPNPKADSAEPQSNIIFSILCESTYPYLLEEGFQPSSDQGDFACPEGMKIVN